MELLRRAGWPVVAVVLLTGCGAPVVVDGGSGAAPSSGAPDLPADGDVPDVSDWTASAKGALECDGKPSSSGGSGAYDSGLATVQPSPGAALEDYVRSEGLEGEVPAAGYRVERADEGRVLLSWDDEQRTKVAFVLADAVRDVEGDVGWGVQVWARCDLVELPDGVRERLGIEVWTDRQGGRVPVEEVSSFPGPEHCDWQDATFLSVGSGAQAQQYLRNPGDLAPYLRTTWSAGAELPADATDSGYRLRGRELWLVPTGEAAYLVSEDDPADVERWPAPEEPIGCA
jgi:hypothetical protein